MGSRRRETVIYRGPRGWKAFDGQQHWGYYTQDDLRRIVAYAAERSITVVPEIEMPGHSQAAIASYPELGNLERKFEVATDWGVIKHTLNTSEETIRFYQDVLTEVMEIFPSKFIHVGGDEAPKDEWARQCRPRRRASGN